jgi:hypothetical protein
MSNVFETLVEVQLKNPEDFLKIKETLTRIGVASRGQNRLSQTCHILHKKGKYYIVHFLEMFMIDGKGKHFSDDDKGRRNTIVNLLEQWGLLTIVNPSATESPRGNLRHIRIVPFKEKQNWELVSKYSIGKANENSY